MKRCAVDGCERDSSRRGWCPAHYARWRKTGSPGSAEIRYQGPPRQCSLAGCGKQARGRGYCETHLARVVRRGEVGGTELQHAVNYDGMICSVDDCGKRPRSRGLCSAHYKRFCRWGDPVGSRPVTPAAERFKQHVAMGTPPPHRPGLGPCHMWIGGKTAQGYGGFHPTKGSMQLAHRWAFVAAGNELRADQVLDHLCRVRACCNPAHLDPVTNEENLRRGLGYGLRNGMRSACIHGHEYTPENTYTDRRGGIRCRTCSRLRDRARTRPAKRKVA